jgi:dTDP-4-amino-4,6-dideoxygalactose transaminase
MSAPPRIYLSAPHMEGLELDLVRDAFATNWIAPLGPHVDAFEREFAARVGSPHAAALSSGTAALHLALRLLPLRPSEEVFVSTLTFSASVNPILYEGGRPVFIDSEQASWNMDPAWLAEGLAERARKSRLPRAVILVHLYGQSADLDAVDTLCRRYGVALIEDAAEALGAGYRGGRSVPVAPGTVGRFGIYSFNGNKIITTSGGGMLVSDDEAMIQKARFLATQARDPAPHYQHSEIGFNYRLSNVLAAIGRGQLRVLAQRVEARRRVCEFYQRSMADLAGIEFMPEAAWGRCTRWLTCILIDPAKFGVDRESVRLALERENIEARPLWKPMHLQPVFSSFDRFGGAVAERLFERGLCLPSGSGLSEGDLGRVTEVVRRCCRP